MSDVLTVKATLTGDASSLIKALQSAQAELGKVSGKADEVSGKARGMGVLSSAISRITKVATIAGGVVGGILTFQSLKGGLERLEAIQNSTDALTGMLGNAKAAADLTAKALAVVQGTPFAFPQFAQATQQLISFGVRASAVPGVLTAIADAAAATGQGSAAVDQLTYAFSKMNSIGKLTGETIDSFAVGGVNAIGLLANALGITTEQARAMVSKGLIPASMATDILLKGIENGSSGAAGTFPKMAGAAQRMGESVSGSIDNLKTAFARMGASALAPFQTLIPTAINTGLIPVLDTAGKAVGALVQKFADTGILQGFIANLAKVGPLIAQTASGTGPLITAFATFQPVLAALGSLFRIVGGAISAVMPYIIAIGTTIYTLGVTLIPPLVGVIGSLVKAIGTGLAAVLPSASSGVSTLAGAVSALAPILNAISGFINNNQILVFSLTGAVLAGVVAYKTYQGTVAAVKAVQSAYKAVMLVVTAAQIGLSMATNAGTVATNLGTGATLAQKAAFIAAKVAAIAWQGILKAGAIATGAVTAAQWLLNAAMDANPIGIIIVAIAALVAGLIWFFTQTKLGQQIWSNFVGFIVAAWDAIVSAVTTAVNWVVSVITTAITPFVTVWNGIWMGISTVIQAVWVLMVSLVTIGIMTIVNIVKTVVGAISTVWNAAWQSISDFIRPIWEFIAKLISTQINLIQSVIKNVTTGISTAWNGIWTGISDFIRGIWDGMVGFVKHGVNGIIDLINGIVGAINSVADVASNLTGGAVKLHVSKLPHMATGGQISQAGYAVVGEHGPEVVKLPKGATVYPNDQGDGTGGGDHYEIKIDASGWSPEQAEALADMVVAKIRFHKGGGK
jgi:tape measure domain-containing protein